MLSFEFSDGNKIVISAEIRKEKGESFNPLYGMLNQYEIVYIIGTESDLIKLRTNIRKDIVRMYPIKAKKENIKKIFISMLHRADKLSKEPEFYNTIYNTCATNILKHVNIILDKKIDPLSVNILLPMYSDKIILKYGFLDTKLSLEEVRKKFDISSIKEFNLYSEDFSEGIRNIINK